MTPQRQVSRRLYEEHVAILELLARLSRALGTLDTQPPASQDPPWSMLLAQLASALDYEVTRHFEFEETQLFPRLHERGEGDLAELLFAEHEEIRPVARELLALLPEARAGRLDAAGWRRLKLAGLELADRLGSHAEKEQGALVPLVDEMLDDSTDEELWTQYAT